MTLVKVETTTSCKTVYNDFKKSQKQKKGSKWMNRQIKKFTKQNTHSQNKSWHKFVNPLKI